MAQQYSFDLRRRPALGRGDYFVSEANAAALQVLDATQNWATGRLILSGPPASGKTHLAHVWAAQTGARLVSAADLHEPDLTQLSEAPLAVDDAHRLAGDPENERALFHLYNLMHAAGMPLLMTATAPPAAWHVSLPDLASRLELTDRAVLAAPDDALLAAVLMKQLSERDLDIHPDVIRYATARMNRSFAAASALAEALNREAFSQRRTLTKPLVRGVLDRL
ncbi:MAG: DnaA/Hda family protein [Pseudomonadota bacterium]